MLPQSPRALDAALLAHFLQFAGQPRNAFRHATPVNFQLRFAGTPHADATALPRTSASTCRSSAGSRYCNCASSICSFAVLRFLRAAQRCRVSTACDRESSARKLFPGCGLCAGTQLVVENNRPHVFLFAERGQFRRLARADVISRCRPKRAAGSACRPPRRRRSSPARPIPCNDSAWSHLLSSGISRPTKRVRSFPGGGEVRWDAFKAKRAGARRAAPRKGAYLR